MPLVREGRRTLVAEDCPGPFYMGWWLYERERRDRRNGGYGDWGWLRSNRDLKGARDLCLSLGYDPPALARPGGDAFEEWFSKTFPVGIRVQIVDRQYVPVRASRYRKPKEDS